MPFGQAPNLVGVAFVACRLGEVRQTPAVCRRLRDNDYATMPDHAIERGLATTAISTG